MESSSTDPRRFLASFRTSASYQQAWAAFFHGKSLTPDVTEAEQREVFEASEQARLALIAYAQQEPFMYDPGCYAPPTSLAINAYIGHVQAMRSWILRRIERDEIVELDRKRSQLHRVAAQALMDEDIVPNIKLGRMLARLVLVAEGIETYQDALQMF